MPCNVWDILRSIIEMQSLILKKIIKLNLIIIKNPMNNEY